MFLSEQKEQYAYHFPKTSEHRQAHANLNFFLKKKDQLSAANLNVNHLLRALGPQIYNKNTTTRKF